MTHTEIQIVKDINTLPGPDEVWYVDHSTLAEFELCREKARLHYVEHYVPDAPSLGLAFGTLFHAAAAAIHKGWPIEAVRELFVSKAKGVLPMTSEESGEKRSIERGLGLLDAYWNMNSKGIYMTDPALVEVGFTIYLGEFLGKPILYIGIIDRISQSRLDNRFYPHELKTTSFAPSVFRKQARPNHQITGYFHVAVETLGLDIGGSYLEIVYVSSRKVSKEFPDGVDHKSDVTQEFTNRSPSDRAAWLEDIKELAYDFLSHKVAKRPRWRRHAPHACNQYGGCQFRDVCIANGNKELLSTNFKIEPWEPWKLQGGGGA